MLLLENKLLVFGVLTLSLLGGCANLSSLSPKKSISPYTQQAEKAFSLMKENHMKAAIPVLQQLATKYPRRAEPHINLSVAYRKLGLAEQSMEAIQQARSLAPKSAMAVHQLGILYREQGNFQDSRGAYEQAIKFDPDYALAHRNLGILLDLYLQKPASALPHYQRYLTLSDGVDKEVSFWVSDLRQRLTTTTTKTKTVSR